MNRDGHTEVLGLRPERVVLRVRVRDPGERVGREEGPLCPGADGTLELRCGLPGIDERDVRDGDQTPGGVAAELADPAVVRARVGQMELRVLELALPGQAKGRVEDGLGQPFAIEERDPLLWIGRSEGRASQVVEARQHPQLLTGLAHATTEDVEAGGGQEPGRLSPDLDHLAIAVHGQPQRAFAQRRIDVALPQIEWLEDVPIGVDDVVV